MNGLTQILGQLERLGAGEYPDRQETDSGAPVPLTKEQALKFLNGVENFKVGDVVQWRPGLRVAKVPAYGQPAVVTQVLRTPHRLGEDELDASAAYDITLGFSTPCGDGECEDSTHLIEALFDSRRFTRVGSIYD